jgi:hypothetical protein
MEDVVNEKRWICWLPEKGDELQTKGSVKEELHWREGM